MVAPGSRLVAFGSDGVAGGAGVVAAGGASVAAGARVVSAVSAVGRSLRVRREVGWRAVVRSDVAAGAGSVPAPGALGAVGSEPVPLGGGTGTAEAVPVAGAFAVDGGSLPVVGPGGALTLVGAGDSLSEVEAGPGSGTVAADPVAGSLTMESGAAVTVVSIGAGTLSPAATAVVAHIQPSTRAGSTARTAHATKRLTALGLVPAERASGLQRLALPKGKGLGSLTRRGSTSWNGPSRGRRRGTRRRGRIPA